MAKIEKLRAKLSERIQTLEQELRLSLQKKSAGPAIDVAKVTTEIQSLKLQLAQLT
jgi:hypothetical protein